MLKEAVIPLQKFASIAIILAAILAAATQGLAAPIVVTPGEASSYVYFPAGVTAQGGGGTTSGLVGQISAFIKLPLPDGWVECDGGLVPEQYPELIDYLGGPGARTPDLRGYFLRGSGKNSDGVGGIREPLSKQSNDIQSHSHAAKGYSAASWPNGVNTWLMMGTASGYHNQNPSTFATGGTETRPHNIAVIYAMRAK